MHSPLHRPPSATNLFPSGPLQDPQASNDMHAPFGHQRVVNENVMGWPWCQSCRPFAQMLLASIAGQGPPPTVAAPWALASPFPEYVCVPALVHRSQLALFSPSTDPPASPTLSPQEQHETASAAPTTSANARQRKPRGVKIACTNCRLANKRCDDGRPCERCKKNGLEHSCVSAERKQRRSRAVRQTATATMTVSTTQVSMERSTILKDDPTMATTVHLPAGTSYVDDGQESTDAANHSSPSGSSVTASDFDNQSNAPAPSTSYAVHANFWASFQPLPTTDSNAQFSNWGFNNQDNTPFFGHGMSPTAASNHHHNLSPTGLQGSGVFPSAGQQF